MSLDQLMIIGLGALLFIFTIIFTLRMDQLYKVMRLQSRTLEFLLDFVLAKKIDKKKSDGDK